MTSINEYKYPTGRVIADGDFDPQALSPDDLRIFAGARDRRAARDILRREIVTGSNEILQLLEDYDAFDVVEQLRTYLIMPLALGAPSLLPGTPLTIELITAILLTRGARTPDVEPPEDNSLSGRIKEVVSVASRLERLANVERMLELQWAHDPLAPLAAVYQGAKATIRNVEYSQIREDHDSALLEDPFSDRLMRQYLGFSYREMILVRDSLNHIAGDRLDALRRRTLSAFSKGRGSDLAIDDFSDEEVLGIKDDFVSLFVRPGKRASISAQDVSGDSGLKLSLCHAVLESFSQKFDSGTSAADAAESILRGDNLFLLKPLICDLAGNYALTTSEIGMDSIRRIFEEAIPSNSNEMRRYDQKVRKVVSETKTTEYLSRILRQKPTYEGLEYFIPKKDFAVDVLSRECSNLTCVGTLAEADALFVAGDVAFCVEVRAKSIASSARLGDVVRLGRELKTTIGKAAEQANRLQDLIERNHGLWLKDRSWLDLRGVRETRSVVVSLDNLGPLGISFQELLQAGMIDDRHTPWIVSLHDLAVVAEVSGRPSEFLLYLRRRTQSDVRKYFKALDELDLYMLFLRGELFVEPDPLGSGQVGKLKKASISRRRATAVPTLVGNLCQPLDDWMAGPSPRGRGLNVTKPEFGGVKELISLVDEVESAAPHVALVLGADVLALDFDTQRKLLRYKTDLINMAKADSALHKATFCAGDDEDQFLIVEAVYPSGGTLSDAVSHLERYIPLKKHQLGAPRAYGLVFSSSGQLRTAMFDGTEVREDPAMDAEVAASGIFAATVSRPLPPSARRAKKRLRGSKKRR